MRGAPQHRNRGKLGGLRHREVVRLLAAKDISRTEIARRYDVTPSAVTQFADRFAEEIRAVEADMEDEFAGIAIASKVARLAAYEELYGIATTPSPKVAPNGKIIREYVTDEDGVTSEAMVMETDVRAAAQLLKQAAEEMGQLPTRLQVAGGLDVTTKYVVEGVAPEDLT